MISSNKPEIIPIEVSSRILRHISRGIYRSPAGALKELISNSYDAGATKVTINTNYPSLDTIIITDDGNGISEKSFRKIISQIGFSDKKLGETITVKGDRKEFERQIIGHYGIGLLAIGQLTKEAIIISKTEGTLEGFKADIDFEQFEIVQKNKIKTAVIKDEAELEKLDSSQKAKFPIGECTLQRVRFDKTEKETSFTKIELTLIREDIKRVIKGEQPTKLFPEISKQHVYSANFEEILKLLREKEKKTADTKIKNQRIPRLKEYFYEMLLWELATYSPVAYPGIKEFETDSELESFSKEATKLEFDVVVDGFILKKPYEKYFWSSKKGYKPIVFKWLNEKYYKNNTASAFIVYQPGTMIRPKIMQGVLVRERGVSVGLYDGTFLNYPFNEGTKFNSLTGEIFAQGLSGAMNIDRDSFNQASTEYLEFTDWFHNKLYKVVFPFIKKYQQKKESPSRTKNQELLLKIFELLSKDKQKIRKLEFQELKGEDKKRLKKSGNKLIINTKHKENRLNITQREKLLLAISLITGEYITTEIFDDVSDEIENYKSKLRSDAKR